MSAILNRDLLRKCARPQSVCYCCRGFASSSPSFAGHNRWSQIKHDKAKNDKAKSKERQIIGKEISSATQTGIPKTVIEAAIARGQGISVTGEALEQVTIEAILPHSVAAVIECQTDQKARILQDLRYAIKDAGGTVTPTTYLFEKKGRIIFEKKDGLNPDDYLDQAIEAGAMDITADEEGRLIVFTEPTETKSVGEALTKSSQLTIEELEIIWDPNRDTLVELTEDEHVREIEDILSTLREESSVRDIYLNTTQQL
ncbi:unnamed protein product [Aspergillus oryzae]|nr:unnamed protein product [Aspergillus oryzae]